MNLHEYYNTVIDNYKSKNYKIRKFKKMDSPISPSPHLEALNYLMYEWCIDHNDERYTNIFDYVIVPNDCDFDFTSITFDDFFKFLIEKKV